MLMCIISVFKVLHHLFQAILHWRVQVRPSLFSLYQVKLCGETCSTRQVSMSLAWITINTAKYELAPLTLGYLFHCNGRE